MSAFLSNMTNLPNFSSSKIHILIFIDITLHHMIKFLLKHVLIDHSMPINVEALYHFIKGWEKQNFNQSFQTFMVWENWIWPHGGKPKTLYFLNNILFLWIQVIWYQKDPIKFTKFSVWQTFWFALTTLPCSCGLHEKIQGRHYQWLRVL